MVGRFRLTVVKADDYSVTRAEEDSAGDDDSSSSDDDSDSSSPPGRVVDASAANGLRSPRARRRTCTRRDDGLRRVPGRGGDGGAGGHARVDGGIDGRGPDESVPHGESRRGHARHAGGQREKGRAPDDAQERRARDESADETGAESGRKARGARGRRIGRKRGETGAGRRKSSDDARGEGREEESVVSYSTRARFGFGTVVRKYDITRGKMDTSMPSSILFSDASSLRSLPLFTLARINPPPRPRRRCTRA